METLRKIFKNKDILKRIGFTLFAFLIFKLFTYVTMPLIDSTSLTSLFENSGFLGIVNSISGDALRNYSIIALGISPYITASIIVQLLQMDIIPALKEWGEEGEVGKRKIARLTRYLAIGVDFVQAIAMTFAFHSSNTSLFKLGVLSWATKDGRNLWFLVYFYIAVVMTAGTAFMIWLSDQITMRGIGNGSSMLIVGGIIISFPGTIASLVQYYIADPKGALPAVYEGQGTFVGYVLFGVSILMFIIVLVGVIYMQTTRKVPIQYANRPASSNYRQVGIEYSAKLNTAKVIPVIFASILMSLPMTISATSNGEPQTPPSGAQRWRTDVSYNQPIGFINIRFDFVSFFYSFILIAGTNGRESSEAKCLYSRPSRIETEAYITKTPSGSQSSGRYTCGCCQPADHLDDPSPFVCPNRRYFAAHYRWCCP